MRWVLLALLGAVGLVVLAAWAWDLEMDLVRMLREARATPYLLLASAAVYALLLALPFMPGMELGLLLMMVFGPEGVVAAYLATMIGLNTAFAAGWVVRGRLFTGSRLARWQLRAERWRDESNAAGSRSWFGGLIAACNRRGGWADYVVIGLLFNLPGNIVLGGGGGISLLAALSGRVHWPGFALTVALATCLLPTLAWFGIIDLERWLLALA